MWRKKGSDGGEVVIWDRWGVFWICGCCGGGEGGRGVLWGDEEVAKKGDEKGLRD